MRGILARFWRWEQSSISRRLILVSVSLWIVSLILLGTAIITIGQTEIFGEIRQRNVQLASVISRDVNAQISGLYSDVSLFCRQLEATDPALDEQAQVLIGLRLAAPERYHGVYLFSRAGDPLISLSDPTEALLTLKSPADVVSHKDVAPETSVMQACQLTGQATVYISDMRFTRLGNTPVLYMGKQISAGREARVVVFEIDLSTIWQRIDLSTIGQSGYTYAVSHDGSIIAHPKASYVGRAAAAELAPLFAGNEGYTDYKDPETGHAVIAAYSPVGGPLGWGIVVVQDRAEANRPITRATAFLGVIWLGLSVAGTLGIGAMVRNFAKPIVGLTATAGNIAETGNLMQAEMVNREDEVGRLSRAFDAMIKKIKESEGRLAQAKLEERNRLARELHDAVSQTLFSASIISDVIPRLWEKKPDEARRRLEEVKQLTRGALAEMRTLLFELRPAALADAEIGHLLKQLAESIGGRSLIPVTVSVNIENPLPVQVKIGLYRITQEALNNVGKHSRATSAAVSLTERAGVYTLRITDNGQGFDSARDFSSSLGLKIMRERAAEAGAGLDIGSVPGGGTTVTAIWRASTEPVTKIM